MSEAPLAVGITCYPSVGGSGILATSLGVALARRGHDVHFISYERPVRLPAAADRISFHPVIINDYRLFRYPDYTLPLSVKMAEVTCRHRLDVMHVHYAVPHATAALLACAMLEGERCLRVVTTLHGTDTTLLGQDPGYRPAIRYAVERSHAITAVSRWLAEETARVVGVRCPIDVVPNFFTPREVRRGRAEVRADLGVADDEVLLVHSSNLRPVKRVDLLLEMFARCPSRCRLLVLAGGPFAPHRAQAAALGLDSRVIVRENVLEVEDYLQAADLGVTTSDSESFCLAVLEGMWFGVPSVATRVGGVPEVIEDGVSGVLVPHGDAEAFAAAVTRLAEDPAARRALGEAARERARTQFAEDVVVPVYEAIYRRSCGSRA